jgi:acetolactate synthase-1/2/3 large subunit
MGDASLSAVQLLLKYLEGEGVEHIFGIPGGPLMPLYEGMHDRGKIRPVLAAHEEGAAFMADGYARVRRGLGVCAATTGPGATNALTGVACSYMDSSPVLVLTAQIAVGAFGKGAAQESSPHGVDVVGLYKPVTKTSQMLLAPEKMSDSIRHTLRTIFAGRWGPAHLNLPADMMRKQVKDDWTAPDLYRARSELFDRSAVQRASRLLVGAKRPAILAGHGVELSGAHAELRALAERLRLPVATTPKGKGAFPENHPLSLGPFGFAGSPRSEAYMLSERDRVDVLLAVGTSLGELETHAWSDKLAPGVALIHVDIDPREIGKNYASNVPVVGDARTVLRELTFHVARELDRCTPNTVFVKRDAELAEFKRRHPAFLQADKLVSDALPMPPQRVVKLLREALPEDGILFVDIGNVMAWAIHYFEIVQPGTFMLNLGLASMGHAVAAAIGGKLAAPQRPVAALVGDAAFLMNGMEVHAAVELGLPVVWVVMNNGGHGMVHHGEKLQFKGKFSTSRFSRPVDAASVAEALGAKGFRADNPDQLRSALAAALSCGGPAVVDAKIDLEVAPPMSLRVETLERFFSGEPAEASA